MISSSLPLTNLRPPQTFVIIKGDFDKQKLPCNLWQKIC